MIAGLTGGIGSGKSTVARVLEILGCAVFNSDDAAKQVYFDAAIKAQVIALLGNESYAGEKELNRSFISTKIFSDTTLLQKLNAVIHPAVKKQFQQFVTENKDRIIIKESALLFEANIYQEMDKIILVAADDETRIRRVMERDQLTHDEVLKKIRSQLPQEEKMKRSDFVINNNETELVIKQVLNIYNQLVSHA
jgi:dephospho-CoA kinase